MLVVCGGVTAMSENANSCGKLEIAIVIYYVILIGFNLTVSIRLRVNIQEIAERMRSTCQREQSNLNGWAIAAGIGSGILLGAVAGAAGHHYLTKKEAEPHSSSICHRRYSDGMCAICQSDTLEIVLLPCGHEYHKACILQMMDNVSMLFCPRCMQEVPDSFLLESRLCL